MADTNYRPARLPYASVIGPLNLELESERDPVRALYLWVQLPGYAASAERGPADLVPGPGSFSLRFDGDAETTLDLDFGLLAGDVLRAGDTGPAVAAAIESAIRSAVDDGSFAVDGTPVTDQERRDELRAATARWDRDRSRLVIASGRRGVATGPDTAFRRPSGVQFEDGALGRALGFDPRAVVAPGRVVRHRRPSPAAVAVDVRFDLWAGTQLELATALDAWARITPTRGQLLERPALLAADAADGMTTIRLQRDGESPTRWTLLQLERVGGRFADRLADRDIELFNGATIDDQGVRLEGNATARLRFLEPPPIPYAWIPEHPGADGYATSMRLKLEPGASAGDAMRVLTIEHDGLRVVALDVNVVQENGELRARVVVTGENEAGSPFGPVTGAIDVADAEGGAEIHVVVDARHGVSLFVEGALLDLTTAPPGRPPGGADMDLVIGDGNGTPVAFVVSHVQFHGRPLGPLDPKLRSSTAPASAWSVGDPVCLSSSEDGVTAVGDPFAATVVAVAGDELTLDRPVQGRFRRRSTLVYERALFFSQRQLRRQDDLMNQLYRICIEYRVSTFLDERFPSVSAPLVEITEVELRDLARLAAEEADPERPVYPVRPATGHPGTRALLTSSVTTGHS